MKPITRAELIAHIRATAERMAQTALLMQYYGGLGEIAQHGRQMEGAARIVHGWADGIEGESVQADGVAGAEQAGPFGV